MIIGIPRSRTKDEQRVALPPRAVGDLTALEHQVLVEKAAGLASGFTDDQYQAAGAVIVHAAEEIYGRSELVLPMQRPGFDECGLIREGQILMSLMHLAVADPALVDLLRERRCTVVDFGTIEDDRGTLPVLRPLSQIAGRMVAQIAARYLQTDHGGLGILLGGAPAVPPAEVVVIGGGTVGRNAVRACLGAGARVTLLDQDLDRITEIDRLHPGRLTTFQANPGSLRKVLRYADVVVGAVLIPGRRTPHLVTREMISLMRERSLVIDISVDQGGCFETSRPTRPSDPTYTVAGVTHYCVPNLPSLVARSATYAMANAILPYVVEMAAGSTNAVMSADTTLARGLQLMNGHVTHAGLASALGCDAVPLTDLMKGS